MTNNGLLVAIVIVLIAGLLFYKKRKKGGDVADYGIEIYDGNGKPVFNSADRLAKFVGSEPLTGDGGVTVNTGGGNLFYAVVYDVAGIFATNRVFPVFTINGNSLTWSYGGNVGVTGTVFYGVY